MTKPAITKRAVKSAALTYSELDQNFQNLADATISLTAGTGGTQVTSDLNGNITLVAGTGISFSGNNTAKTITITASTVATQISQDTNPQLGADLDLNGFKIKTVTGDLVLDPAATNDVVLNTEGLAIGDGLGVATIYSQNGSYPGIVLKSHSSYPSFVNIQGGQNGNIYIEPNGSGQIIVGNSSNSPKIAAIGSNSIVLGKAVLQDGTTFQGNITIQSKTLELGKFTTTERNALSAQLGMLIYNTTTNKIQGSAEVGGTLTWVDLH